MLKYQQIKLTYVLQVYTNQEDLEAFNTVINTYNAFNKSILKHIHFIIVDDCSPVKIVLPENCNLNYTLARVKTDIKWNQPGARNLGVHLAKSQKLILTDLDHLFTEENFKRLLKLSIPNNIFIFRRLNQENKEIASHYNTFFMSKSVFYKTLGIDEEFCGNYGHEDVFFLDMQKRLGTKILKFRELLISSYEHKNTNKPQHNLIRNEAINRPLYEAKRRILFDKNRDPFDAHSRLFLNFEWEIIDEQINL